MRPATLPYGSRDFSKRHDLRPQAVPANRASRSVLGRGIGLALAAFALGLLLANRNSIASRYLMMIPFMMAVAAIFDTARSMRVTWDFHHGGVVLLLYADMMRLTLIAVWTIWPT